MDGFTGSKTATTERATQRGRDADSAQNGRLVTTAVMYWRQSPPLSGHTYISENGLSWQVAVIQSPGELLRTRHPYVGVKAHWQVRYRRRIPARALVHDGAVY